MSDTHVYINIGQSSEAENKPKIVRQNKTEPVKSSVDTIGNIDFSGLDHIVNILSKFKEKADSGNQVAKAQLHMIYLSFGYIVVSIVFMFLKQSVDSITGIFFVILAIVFIYDFMNILKSKKKVTQ